MLTYRLNAYWAYARTRTCNGTEREARLSAAGWVQLERAFGTEMLEARVCMAIFVRSLTHVFLNTGLVRD